MSLKKFGGNALPNIHSSNPSLETHEGFASSNCQSSFLNILPFHSPALVTFTLLTYTLIMIDPYLTNRAQKRTQIKLSAASKAKAKNKAFLRKTQFALFKQQGLPDDEAARRVGIKIPFGRRFNIIDIMKKITEGE